MIKKGVISNIDKDNASAGVIIHDENEVVTAMLPLARSIDPNSIAVGQLCVVALFDSDYISLADGAIIAIVSGTSNSGGNGGGTGIDIYDATATAEDIMNGKTAYVKGEKVEGTFTLEEELATQDGLISEIQEAIADKTSTNE